MPASRLAPHMDTITHGIAGALLGKALFRGENMFARTPVSRGKIVTWSLMLGAIFPDIDTVRDFFSHNPLLMLTWHRSITHSLVCMPLFALLLAALTLAVARWRKWEAPSFALLTVIYAVGILSHILLDLATSFGTMIWWPLNWSRPAWDLLFIVDFAFTAILLVPQFLAVTYSNTENLWQRALNNFVLFGLGAVVVGGITRYVGAPISGAVVLIAIFVLAVAFLFPLWKEWGLRLSPTAWNCCGLAAMLLYLGLAISVHHIALERVKKMVPVWGADVQSVAALPLPPSVWHWDGLALAPQGVYEMDMDFGGESNSGPIAFTSANRGATLSYRFYPDAAPNQYIEKAKKLPEVKTVLWFDRFPLTRFHLEGTQAVVEISDMRFSRLRPGRPAAFTYQVRFSSDGTVLSQGWEQK